MKPPLPARRVWSVSVRIAVPIGVAAYAYWATGLRPFTVPAYVAVGIPVAAVTAVVVAMDTPDRTGDRRLHPARDVTLRRVMPWLLGALLALALEGVALALGGRSAAVPTLSTVVDHALAWHAVRLALFCAWLLIGSIPLISTLRGRRRVVD